MHPFTYQFNGETILSNTVPYIENGYPRYRVCLADGLEFVIVPSGIRGLKGKIIWVQSNNPTEIVQPHELVQAMGEGVEKIFTISLPKLFFS